MMKRFASVVAIALVVLCLGLPAKPISAAPSAITYTSTFQLQNLSGTQATVAIAYYDRATGNNTVNFSDTVPANGSRTYAPISHLSSPFDGSAVVSSDQQLVAIVNLAGDPGGNALQYFDTTVGLASGSTSVNLPLIMRGNFGFDTFFNVQNTGSADASGNVRFSNGAVESFSGLKPGAAKRFDQSGDVNLPATFVGAATITGTQPLAVSLMQVATGSIKTLAGYNGFTSAAPSLNFPLIMANNFGFYTSYQIQNTGSLATVVTITYSPNTAGAFAPVPEQLNLAPGASGTILQRNNQWGPLGTAAKKYVGSARITANTANQPLVAIINQQCFAGTPGAACGASIGSTYTGFENGTGTNTVSMPLVMANNFNYYTSWQVQNVGTGNCTSVTATYSANTAGAYVALPDSVANLAIGASATFLQRGGQWGAYPTPAKRYVGSGTVVGSGAGCLLAIIVNQQNLIQNSGDIFSTYNGFNH